MLFDGLSGQNILVEVLVQLLTKMANTLRRLRTSPAKKDIYPDVNPTILAEKKIVSATYADLLHYTNHEVVTAASTDLALAASKHVFMYEGGVHPRWCQKVLKYLKARENIRKHFY